jgi:hypothetical protein
MPRPPICVAALCTCTKELAGADRTPLVDLKGVPVKKLSIAMTLGALAVTLLTAPGLAGTQAVPEVSDRSGDANFANSNGQGGSEVGAGTAPASIDSADLRAIWLETAYSKRIEVALGDVHWVRYEPTGLKINFQTTAPAKPTFGPSVIFRYPALLDSGCTLNFEAWVKGSAAVAVDREYASVVRLASCPGGTIPNDALSLSSSGNVLTATFPFSAMAGVLAKGMSVGPHATSRPHVRVVLGAATVYGATAPVIDEAARGGSFVIGSDVPADVNCTEQPAHPDCA